MAVVNNKSSRIQDVRTSMMPYMRGYWRTGMSRLASVSLRGSIDYHTLNHQYDLQISLMSLFSFTLIHLWIKKPLREGRRCIWWTRELTCYHLYLGQTFAH